MAKIISAVVITALAVCCFSGVSFAGSKKPPKEPEPPILDWESYDADKEDYDEFYAKPEDLNEDGVIDSRDRFLWHQQQKDEMVVD